MRLLKFAAGGQRLLGVQSGDEIISLGRFADHADVFNNDNLDPLLRASKNGGARFGLDEVDYQPPLADSARVFCVGINFLKKHPIAGVVSTAPERPTIFVKLAESFVGHRQAIEYPEGVSERLDYEGELAVVIGRGGRHIRPEDAYQHVFGYTLVNDGSVRDWQKHSLVSGKNFFHSSSCGPWVVTADEVDNPMTLDMITEWNGEVVQSTNMNAMLFDIPYVINHISQFTPLKPGDIIATGTPAGSGGSMDPQRFLRPGDKIKITISGLGTLSNTVA